MLWRLVFDPTKVIFLGTNGDQNNDDGFDDFQTFGVYYRLMALQEIHFSGTSQTVNIDNTVGTVQEPILSLTTVPVEPSQTVSMTYTIIQDVSVGDTLNFNG